jgi:hypothetical protein
MLHCKIKRVGGGRRQPKSCQRHSFCPRRVPILDWISDQRSDASSPVRRLLRQPIKLRAVRSHGYHVISQTKAGTPAPATSPASPVLPQWVPELPGRCGRRTSSRTQLCSEEPLVNPLGPRGAVQGERPIRDPLGGFARRDRNRRHATKLGI